MSFSPLPSSDADEADLTSSPQPQTSGSARNIAVSLLLSALVLAGVGYATFDAAAMMLVGLVMPTPAGPADSKGCTPCSSAPSCPRRSWPRRF